MPHYILHPPIGQESARVATEEDRAEAAPETTLMVRPRKPQAACIKVRGAHQIPTLGRYISTALKPCTEHHRQSWSTEIL